MAAISLLAVEAGFCERQGSCVRMEGMVEWQKVKFSNQTLPVLFS